MTNKLNRVKGAVSALALVLGIAAIAWSSDLMASEQKMPTSSEKPKEFNAAWDTIQRYQPFKGQTGLGEIAMTISGTFVKPKTGEVVIMEPAQDTQALIDAAVYGGRSVEVLSCQDARCLEIGKKEITIPVDQSLVTCLQKIMPRLHHISMTDVPLENEEEAGFVYATLPGVINFSGGEGEIDWSLVYRQENAEVLAKTTALFVSMAAEAATIRAYQKFYPQATKDEHPWKKGFESLKKQSQSLAGELKAFQKKEGLKATQKAGDKA